MENKSQNNAAPMKRCAVYTRKSHEDGHALEQEFNSLDAQRESAENYIASQKANGWISLPEKYDDMGFSGGTMERPALKRLLSDIEAGKIDIIVIYKFDRLSRSLLDFIKIVEFFETRNVSIVSVTQQINTSTSAGRMMLNILMTFAQYEREIITERIRDKIAATKRRGKYCGGPPLLGYDADSESKKLIINYNEAKTVKLAFELYCKFGSARQVAIELNKNGLQTKDWTSRKTGKFHPGGYFNQGCVQRMLANPLYVGKVHHNGELFKGEHNAVISDKLWSDVQRILHSKESGKGFKKKEIDSPFKGLLKCGYCGGSMGLTYTIKNRRRYTYYLCIKDKKRAISECPLVRIPAGDADRMILQQLGRIFKTPTMLANIYTAVRGDEVGDREKLIEQKDKLLKESERIKEEILKNSDEGVFELKVKFRDLHEEIVRTEELIRKCRTNGVSIQDIISAFESIEALWNELFPLERYRLAHMLINKIIIMHDKLRMEINTDRIVSLVKEMQSDTETKLQVSDDDSHIISLEVPIRIKYKRGRKMIIMPDSEREENKTPVQEMIFRALARAHSWHNLIESGEAVTISQLAEKLNLDKSYVGRIFRLINLAPDIQEAIIQGKESNGLSLEKLREYMPDEWQEQRQLFGVSANI